MIAGVSGPTSSGCGLHTELPDSANSGHTRHFGRRPQWSSQQTPTNNANPTSIAFSAEEAPEMSHYPLYGRPSKLYVEPTFPPNN
jgi:hypothetical protein